MKEEIINCTQIYANKNRLFKVYTHNKIKYFEDGSTDEIFVCYGDHFFDDSLEIGYKGIYWHSEDIVSKEKVSWEEFLSNLNNRDQESGFIEFKKGSIFYCSFNFVLMFSFLKNIRSIVWKHYYDEYYEKLDYEEIENYEEEDYDENKDFDFSFLDNYEEEKKLKEIITSEEIDYYDLKNFKKNSNKKQDEGTYIYSLEDPYITED